MIIDGYPDAAGLTSGTIQPVPSGSVKEQKVL
jgi:hypothetical protein